MPTRNNAARVNLWRQLKKCGALPIKTSAYILPDESQHHERLLWLAQQVRDRGGEATIVHASQIEGLRHEDIIRQFNQARAADYNALIPALNRLVSKRRKHFDDALAASLERLTQQFEEIRKIDFFKSPRAQDVQMLMKRASSLRDGKSTASQRLLIRKYLARTWLTRPRPEIDRIGSAWLIGKFIDRKAKFIFGPEPSSHPDAIPYDMFEVEFSHHGDDCTFETLVKRFGITDNVVLKIAEMVHDADLEDGKFQTMECIGIDRVLKGWAKAGLSDKDLLERGTECFEALYRQLQK